MLAQIKGLPEGDMKNSLLKTFIKTVKAEQKGKNFKIPKRQPLFLDASFDKNTKTYIKFNRETKLHNISVIELAKEVILLRKEVSELKETINRLDDETSFKVDSWARQEIKQIKERLDSIPPPLEDAPFETVLLE